MAYTRADIRTEVRDRLAEDTASSSGIWSDAQINRFIAQEIRSLHRRGIYSREKDTTNTVVDQYDYTFPSGCYKVDMIERNWGTSDKPLWEPVDGWSQDDSALYLGARPMISWVMRITFRKKYSVLTDDSTSSDIPDDKMDVVVLGSTIRALQRLAGYLGNVANWDSISKPDGVSINSISGLLAVLKKEYRELVAMYKTVPDVREINLIG